MSEEICDWYDMGDCICQESGNSELCSAESGKCPWNNWEEQVNCPSFQIEEEEQ